MATKTKPAVRTGTGKGGRRPPVKVKRGSDIPLLPIAVGGILLAFAIGVIIYSVVNNPKTAPGPAVAAGIRFALNTRCYSGDRSRGGS